MRRAIGTTPRVLGAAVAGVFCLAGCGHGEERTALPPKLPRALAVALAARSEAVADAIEARDSCRAWTLAAQLQQATIAAINRGRVAAPLQEPLSASVNDLFARVKCVPPPRPAAKEHGRGKHKGHEQKHEEGD
jgi:hypothetical protein